MARDDEQRLQAYLAGFNAAAEQSMWNPVDIARYRAQTHARFSVCYSRWLGVSISGRKRLPWQAHVGRDRKLLGYFKNEYDAAQAYNFAAYDLYGDNYQPNEAYNGY